MIAAAMRVELWTEHDDGAYARAVTFLPPRLGEVAITGKVPAALWRLLLGWPLAGPWKAAHARPYRRRRRP